MLYLDTIPASLPRSSYRASNSILLLLTISIKSLGYNLQSGVQQLNRLFQTSLEHSIFQFYIAPNFEMASLRDHRSVYTMTKMFMNRLKKEILYSHHVLLGQGKYTRSETEKIPYISCIAETGQFQHFLLFINSF